MSERHSYHSVHSNHHSPQRITHNFMDSVDSAHKHNRVVYHSEQPIHNQHHHVEQHASCIPSPRIL